MKIPSKGITGVILASGSMSSNKCRAGNFRRALIESDLLHYVVTLLGQLFSGTHLPVRLSFLSKTKTADAKRGFRDRR